MNLLFLAYYFVHLICSCLPRLQHARNEIDRICISPLAKLDSKKNIFYKHKECVIYKQEVRRRYVSPDCKDFFKYITNRTFFYNAKECKYTIQSLEQVIKKYGDDRRTLFKLCNLHKSGKYFRFGYKDPSGNDPEEIIVDFLSDKSNCITLKRINHFVFFKIKIGDVKDVKYSPRFAISDDNNILLLNYLTKKLTIKEPSLFNIIKNIGFQKINDLVDLIKFKRPDSFRINEIIRKHSLKRLISKYTKLSEKSKKKLSEVLIQMKLLKLNNEENKSDDEKNVA